MAEVREYSRTDLVVTDCLSCGEQLPTGLHSLTAAAAARWCRAHAQTNPGHRAIAEHHVLHVFVTPEGYP